MPSCRAVRVTNVNLTAVAAWCGGQVWAGQVVVPVRVWLDGQWKPGEETAAPGDWVARLDQRFDVYRDSTFRADWMRPAVTG